MRKPIKNAVENDNGRIPYVVHHILGTYLSENNRYFHEELRQSEGVNGKDTDIRDADNKKPGGMPSRSEENLLGGILL